MKIAKLVPWSYTMDPFDQLGLREDGSDMGEAYGEAQRNIDKASERVISGYNTLIGDFETALMGYGESVKGSRLALADSITSRVKTQTESLISQAGPLNESSKAKLRLQMTAPITRQMLEEKLGTYDSDLSIGMGTILGSLQLQREKMGIINNAISAKSKNQAGYDMWKQGQPPFLERALGWGQTAASVGATMATGNPLFLSGIRTGK